MAAKFLCPFFLMLWIRITYGTPIIIEVDSGNVVFSHDHGMLNESVITVPKKSLKPMDCAEVINSGFKKSGVYTIWPRGRKVAGPLEVYCDMETDNGGWTVIQRRGNFLRPKDYFNQNWYNYKNGFGDIERDFWLGNDYIHALADQGFYSVRFDLHDGEGEHRYALYDVFYIEDEAGKYRLTIQDYSGTAGDSMNETHNGQKFSTKDQDNDNSVNKHCGMLWEGGWWHNDCYKAFLNGPYLHGKHDESLAAVHWYAWQGFGESLDITEIKIRPKNFRRSFVGDYKVHQ